MLKVIIYFHQPLIQFDFFAQTIIMNIWLNNFLFFSHIDKYVWDSCKSRHIAEKPNWDVDCFSAFLFTFVFFCLLCHFTHSHLKHTYYFLTTRFMIFIIVFSFFIFRSSNHDFMIISWFFFRCGGGDGFSIHIYDALVWCKVFFQSAAF